LQAFVSIYYGETLQQMLAYINLGIIVIGFLLLIKEDIPFSKTAKNWIFFYVTYYVLSGLGSVYYSNSFDILKTLVPVVYCIGFMSFLRFDNFRVLFEKIATLTFLMANALLIVFINLNFDLDRYGQNIDYGLDRAQGVYGDANNAALAGIVGFIFLFQVYKPKKFIFKILKIILLLATIYAVILTLSTTGLGVVLIVLIILFKKKITKQYILLGLIILPILYVSIINIDKIIRIEDLNVRQQRKVDNIINILTFDFEEVDTAGRNNLLEKTMDYIYDNPFLGRGLYFGIEQRSHNTFATIWVDSGILGLLIFFYLLLIYFKGIYICRTDVKYPIFALFFVLTVFMLSLQSVINQPYLMSVFIYMAYIIDNNKNTFKSSDTNLARQT
jgi:O-antigen ligase